MTILPLFLIVFVQIIVFQIVLVRLSRALPGILIGTEALPESTSRQVARYESGLGASRRVLGIVLLIGSILAAFVLPLDPGPRKLILACLSLVSSGSMITGYLLDRRRVLRIVRDLPESDRAIASLRPRSLRTFYHPAWEAVPFGILTLSAFVTIRANPPGFAPWLFLVFQAVIIFYMTAVSWNAVNRHSCLTPRTKTFHRSPEEALRLEHRLRAMEVRHSFLTKIALSILFAVIQVRRFAGVSEPARGLLFVLELVMIFVVMAWFVRYIMVVGKLRKEMSV